MNRLQKPLYDALMHHKNRQTASFHVPGHKSGRGNFGITKGDPLANAMSIDLTEVAGLDDLHHPEECIHEAQQLAAECFGSEETFFLVNGSTVGNLAAILSVCGRGDMLLVQRNAHKSVLHGLMLAGAEAVFLPPEWDAHTGQSAGIRQEALDEALRQYPQAKGLFLTNPNYYGFAADLQPIAEKAHRHGMPLIVDEAHGAHFGFHAALPPSALSCGADIVIQSTHKMLTAMTMGAMLHLQGKRVNRSKLRQALAMLQSSSPSYPIMASLDAARWAVHTGGPDIFIEGLKAAGRFKELMRQLPAFQLLERGDAFSYLDPFKVTVRDRAGIYSGYDLLRMLDELGCIGEMADPDAVLLAFSLCSTEEDARRLYEAFAEIARIPTDNAAALGEAPVFLNHTVSRELSLPVPFDFQAHGAGASGSEAIPLEDAPGRRSAEMVVPYPPGIPILYTGEQITPALVEHLQELRRLKAKVQGISDSTLATLNVFINR